MRTYKDVKGVTCKNGEEWLIKRSNIEAHIPDVYEEVHIVCVCVCVCVWGGVCVHACVHVCLRGCVTCVHESENFKMMLSLLWCLDPSRIIRISVFGLNEN